MSKRHDLDLRRHNLGEIREILDAMKSFAFMETRKLSRVLGHQHQLIANLEAAARDFKKFYLTDTPREPRRDSVVIAIGTERGFCGDINHSLAAFVKSALSATEDPAAHHLITVGRRLNNLFAEDKRVAAHVEGASVLDDLDTILQSLVEKLGQIQSRHDWVALRVIHHGSAGEIVDKTLLPPFSTFTEPEPEPEPQRGYPPLLTLAPEDFFLQLTEQYLFAALNESLADSLMEENHRRVSHLEQAVRHLTDEEEQLLRRSNSLRQEEITEELEVILLSADMLNDPGSTP